MNINDEIIDYISDLAKLKLTENEKQKQKQAIQSVIEYTQILNLLDTSKLENINKDYLPKNIFRQDCIDDSYSIEDILSNAIETEANCYKVPKIIK